MYTVHYIMLDYIRIHEAAKAQRPAEPGLVELAIVRPTTTTTTTSSATTTTSVSRETGRSVIQVRPVRLLRVRVSEGLTQANS